MRYSYSALQDLALCERKFSLRHIEGLEADRQDKPAPLRGTAWHAVMQAELLRIGAQRDSLLVKPEKIQILKGWDLTIDWSGSVPTIMGPQFGPEVPLGPLEIVAHIRDWWSRQETDYREEMEADYGAPLPDRLHDLYIRYTGHWSSDLERYTPLVTEYEWAREFQGKLLQGRCDAIVYDNELGIVLARDYKTHDSWPSEPEAVLDLMDSQLHLQAWGLAPLLKEHNLIPQGVQFDRVRFKKPTEPKLTTKGVLSKTVSDFDSYTYRRWCQSNDVTVDQAVIDACDAKTDAWFRRSQKPLSMKAINLHVQSAYAQIERAEKLDAKKARMVPSKACSWCDYLSLCRADMLGGRPDEFVLSDFGLRRSN